MKKHIIFLAIFTILSFSQTFRLSITIEAARLPESEQARLMQIIPKIQNYVETYSWTEIVQAQDIEMELDLNIFVQSISESGTEKVYHAQAMWTNHFDQKYFDKNWAFSLDDNNTFIHSVIPNPVNDFLDFYAYLFLAGELDTYEYRLGNSAFAKAEEVCNRAASSNFRTGWKSRLERIFNISSNLPFRQLRDKIYIVRDELFDPEYQDSTKSFYGLLELRNEIIEGNWNDKYYDNFWEVHHRELALDLFDTKRINLLDQLLAADSENAKFYSKLIDDLTKPKE